MGETGPPPAPPPGLLRDIYIYIYIYIYSLTVAVLIQRPEIACMGALGEHF